MLKGCMNKFENEENEGCWQEKHPFYEQKKSSEKVGWGESEVLPRMMFNVICRPLQLDSKKKSFPSKDDIWSCSCNMNKKGKRWNLSTVMLNEDDLSRSRSSNDEGQGLTPEEVDVWDVFKKVVEAFANTAQYQLHRCATDWKKSKD